MQVLIKTAVSVAVILLATAVAKKAPSIAGLVAVMPLTGALVLVFVYLENKGNSGLMQTFTQSAIWGMLPTMLFFFVAFLCFRKQLPLPLVLIAGFGAWFLAAMVHQWLLR
ncbi:MAG: DUF3147 family protein [Thermodesulfobacteriota bacterium]